MMNKEWVNQTGGILPQKLVNPFFNLQSSFFILTAEDEAQQSYDKSSEAPGIGQEAEPEGRLYHTNDHGHGRCDPEDH
jgi:hypothetical protein